ncbi:MAG: hypothetical protein QXZ31_05530 [Thermofilaceae archaeon]
MGPMLEELSLKELAVATLVAVFIYALGLALSVAALHAIALLLSRLMGWSTLDALSAAGFFVMLFLVPVTFAASGYITFLFLKRTVLRKR